MNFRTKNCMFLLLMGCLALGCLPFPLDIMGESVAVSNEESLIKDDSLEDKNPIYDPDRLVTEYFGEDIEYDYCDITLNKSATITRLDIADLGEDDAFLHGAVYPNRVAAFDAVAKLQNADRSVIPSLEVVNGALKPFNDGLYAAIELSVQQGLEVDGAPVFPSKRTFLAELLTQLETLLSNASSQPQTDHLTAAAIDIATALILSGDAPDAAAHIVQAASQQAEDFKRSASLYSKPIGFYTWNDQLEGIFTQDRFLQNYQGEAAPFTDTEMGKAAALAVALGQDPSLLQRYEQYLSLYTGLTNPFANYPVTALLDYLDGPTDLDRIGQVRTAFLADNPQTAIDPICGPHFAVFPSSRSKETEYFERLYCGPGAPPDVNYMEQLIIAIRDGLIDLKPDPDSGWYDYQSYALETLLLPERGAESDHLLLTKAYKEKLLETFESIMTQNRETHVKQLDMGVSLSSAPTPEADLYPLFPVEPFPTFYLRNARAYRFLSTYLQGVLGAEFLASTTRIVEDGTSGELSLADELTAKTTLLYGLHLNTADAVGMKHELLPEELEAYGEETCREAASDWSRQWSKDPDVGRDPRIIVPVQRDNDRQEVIYWAIIGIKVVRANAEFVEGYAPRDISSYCWTGEIVPHDYYLLMERFTELRLPMSVPPPTREEFRAACDENPDPEAITAALSAN